MDDAAPKRKGGETAGRDEMQQQHFILGEIFSKATYSSSAFQGNVDACVLLDDLPVHSSVHRGLGIRFIHSPHIDALCMLLNMQN